MTKAERSRKKSIKVLFLFQGTTHYYNLVLSKLNSHPEIDVSDVVPTAPQNLGEGVYQTREGIQFTLFEAQQYLKEGMRLLSEVAETIKYGQF